ncbi:protein of unknown function [Caloramator quimbayensis]|uniref:J domain-containing protein n=1 Tax=Caloramator quimbayensis TaxID=1147123 RepID=A0A1T4XXP9_9CLOT|nr:DUF4932 domain-containing protein [Caloramator quimbayensis]SKA93988.1 protein of unknown function [Caloramator quimbayensis]
MKKIIFILAFALLVCIGVFMIKFNKTSIENTYVTKTPISMKLIPQSLNIYKKISDNLTIRSGVNSDLLFVAASAGAEFKNHPSYLVTNDKYELNNKFKKYFSGYKYNESAEKIYEAAKSMDNPPKKFVGPILHDILKYDENILFNKSNEASEVLSCLEKFSQDSKAEEFFKSNNELYIKMINDFTDEINFDYIKRLEDFFGEKPKNSKFVVVLSTVMDGGQATHIELDDGSVVYYNIMNPSQDKHNNLLTLYHETAHNFYDVSLKNKDLIAKYLIYSDIVGKNENNFERQINETIIRAVTAIVLEKYHPDIDAKKDIITFEKQGYKNLNNIYELIKSEYLTNRQNYKTFNTFVPVIFEFIKNSSKNN